MRGPNTTLMRIGCDDVQWRVLPHDTTVRTALAEFAQARTVIAPHGAGLSNLVACRRGTRVVEIGWDGQQGMRMDDMYARLATAMDLEYRLVVGSGEYSSKVSARPATVWAHALARSRHVIMAACVNYGLNTYRTFVRTLRASGYTADIVLWVGADVTAEVRHFCTQHRVTLHYGAASHDLKRYAWYADVCSAYDACGAIDVRDALLPSGPVRTPAPSSSCVCKRIFWNEHWSLPVQLRVDTHVLGTRRATSGRQPDSRVFGDYFRHPRWLSDVAPGNACIHLAYTPRVHGARSGTFESRFVGCAASAPNTMGRPAPRTRHRIVNTVGYLPGHRPFPYATTTRRCPPWSISTTDSQHQSGRTFGTVNP